MTDRSTERVRIEYLRPPDRRDLFVQSLVLEASDVVITLARSMSFSPALVIDGQVALEDGSDAVWFTFPGAWHDIGLFHRADGSFTGTYANILTPPVMEDRLRWRTTDLFLDIWVDPSGTMSLLDEDQFQDALARGWISMEEAASARAEVNRIQRAFAEGTWPPPVVDAWSRERAIGILEGHSPRR